MNRVFIAVCIMSLVSLGGTAAWYYNQMAANDTATEKLKLLSAKHAEQNAFKFNAVSNVENVKALLVHLAEMDIADIWITKVAYEHGKVDIKYRARNAAAVTEYLQAFYDKIKDIPFLVDEVSANEKGKQSTKVANKRVRKVPFVIAYIQKKLQQTRSLVTSKKAEKIEQDYNYELSIKLEEE